MKRALFIIGLLCSNLLFAADHEVQLKSSINQVIVYQQGAQVERSAKTLIQPGINLVVFGGLPTSLDPNLIRFSGKGDYQVLATYHRIKVDTISGKEIPKKNDELARRRSEIQAKIDRENGWLAIYDKEEFMLQSNQIFTHKDEGISVEKLREAAAFIRERYADIRAQRLEIQDRVAILQEQINNINIQVSKLGYPVTMGSLEVVVRVQADKQVNGEFNITYQTYNAGWYPTYDAYVGLLSEPLKLACNAFVYQTSGEDWKSVKLTVATGSPAQNRTKPQLQPWYVGGHPVSEIQPSDMKLAESTNSYAPSMVDSYDLDERFAPFAPVAISYGPTNTRYQVSSRYDIPGDNSQTSVRIKEMPIDADYVYLCTPKLDKTAFLSARLTNWEELDLMNASLNVYFDNNYVGQTDLIVDQTADTLNLSLGIDERIEVIRKRGKVDQKKQILAGKKTDVREFEYSVKNNKREKINIIIDDQVPVALNEQIEVEIETISGGHHNPSTGRVTWEMKIDAGKTKTFKLKYGVTTPRELFVQID
ncbi:MAG: mucoidy inhibitor MuiA family protein [Cryomorphaceae bacterium]|nr:mucoidy inhibitor MuiA family protein [Cryomorphaceae bacterium]